MNTQVLKKALVQIMCYIGAYFKEFLLPKIKESFLKSKTVFIETLWESLKDDLQEQIKSAAEYVERFFNTPEYALKEKAILDIVFDNIQLPLVAKPFKPLIRRILRDKLRNFIKSTLKKLNQQV